MSDQAEKTVSKKKPKKDRGPARSERRFVAQSANNPWLVRLLGVLGASTLGAGLYGYFYGESFKKQTETVIPLYMVAFAAVVLGITIWLGTTSEPALRVGSAGLAMERGDVRRMPWWGISKITWEASDLALVIAGIDESGTDWTFKVSLKSHGDAIGWILKEALDRVPKVVDIADNVVDEMPGAGTHAGSKIDLEPLQVVGKRDAISGKTISYEPDARVCVRCERVYAKSSVPKKCKCGASLLALRGEKEEPSDESESDAAEALA